GWDAARWLTDARSESSPGFADAYAARIARRAAYEPVAYITGHREFAGRDFLVTPAVLIPRPDTEVLVDAAIARTRACDRPAPLVVDVGTGSGCVAISLAAECPTARVVATDVSPDAIEVARRNAAAIGVSDRVAFRQGSMLAGLADAPDLIVSNPPYIRDADRSTLPPDVAHYEPALALDGGPDGLDAIRLLIASAAALAPGGWLLFEMAFDQETDVRALVASSALEAVDVLPDIEARPRVMVARRTPRPASLAS
ncbi:MAG TPA: peptide chain release factor N(5)-glutamine methyltransferase, partial [Vicinamibacterales bacterium]|nr:peptide chain release factor N(5)-glutamine methyltransferase [Vicinamibacterales bacterium]